MHLTIKENKLEVKLQKLKGKLKLKDLQMSLVKEVFQTKVNFLKRQTNLKIQSLYIQMHFGL